MNNRNIIIGIRESLALNKGEMLKIYVNGGIDLDEVALELVDGDKSDMAAKQLKVDNETLENFLNGLIVLKRGPREQKPGQSLIQPLAVRSEKSINNVVLKKLKIVLSLTNEDIVEMYASVGVVMSKAELTTLFRKQGHKHYKLCTDFHMTKFLEAMGKNRLSNQA